MCGGFLSQVLAIANLASDDGTHNTFIEEGMLPHLVSLSNSKNSEIRQFAAFSLVKMTQNSNIRQVLLWIFDFTSCFVV
jgi:hypothetical protein